MSARRGIAGVLGGMVLVAALGACTPTGAPDPTASAKPSTSTPSASSQAPTPSALPSATGGATASSPDSTTSPAPTSALAVEITWLEWDATAAVARGSAVVQGVVEMGGTCTVTAEGPGEAVTVEAPAEPDAASTICGGWELAGLTSGTWDVVVHYASTTSDGDSSAQVLEVP